MSDEAQEFVEALVIKPGDHILVRVPSMTTLDHVHAAGKTLEARFPDCAVTVVACEQIAVYRGGGDEKGAQK